MTVEIKNISKSYAGVRVLNDVSLSIGPGEVHALLGPNGAGKSTLIKCIGGAVRPDSGTMQLEEDTLDDLTPSKAFAHGIAVIHQHLSLVDTLSVTENLFLGDERVRIGLVRRRAQRREAREILSRFGLEVSGKSAVRDLPIGMKQLVEIAKAWHRTDVKLMILDEPTASLSERETRRLFDEIRRMKDRGVPVIYTTHRLGEVFEIADKVSVLRDGSLTLNAAVSDLEPADLYAAIAGASGRPARGRRAPTGRPVLEVANLEGPRFGPLSFVAREGEVLALYGVLGSGRTSLLETIAGRFRATAGTVRVDGRPVTVRSPRSALRAGIALVPSDRARQALWSTTSAQENMLMATYRRLAPGGLRRRKEEKEVFMTTAALVDLQPREPKRRAGNFSGGNQQKLVIGRWLTGTQAYRVLLLDEPSQGVDVGAREQIHDVCKDLSSQGVAVVCASTDAEEVAAFADRVLVIDRGHQLAELVGADITEKALLSLAHEFTADRSHEMERI